MPTPQSEPIRFFVLSDIVFPFSVRTNLAGGYDSLGVIFDPPALSLIPLDMGSDLKEVVKIPRLKEDGRGERVKCVGDHLSPFFLLLD